MKMRKLISAAAILALTAAWLSGCGKNQNYGLDPSKPTTITIWHYYNGVQQENFDDMIVEFNETVGYVCCLCGDSVSRRSDGKCRGSV